MMTEGYFCLLTLSVESSSLVVHVLAFSIKLNSKTSDRGLSVTKFSI